AGERRCPRRDERRAHVVLAHELRGAPLEHGALNPAVAPERRLADALEEEVQADGEDADDALAQTVVGHVAQTELLPRGHRQPDDGRPEEADVAVARAPLPGDR